MHIGFKEERAHFSRQTQSIFGYTFRKNSLRTNVLLGHVGAHDLASEK
jgi:hypothetical protein